MTHSDRVVWDEGMLLTPQHLQQWDRHLHSLLHRRGTMLLPHLWGLTRITFDPDALLGGELALTTISGVMPDGLLFEAPERDPLPPPRKFKELFSAQADTLGAYLAIPSFVTGSAAVSDDGVDGNRPTPFRRRLAKIVDEIRPGAEREIAVAVPNLRLLFDGEVLDDYHRIKVAAIQRTDTGTYAVSPKFIPTCIHLSASPALQGILRRTIEVLSTRSEELAGRQRQTAGMAGAANLWLLHTVNSPLPALLHQHRQQRVHPAELFLTLSALAGQLCTFASQEHPRNLPAYEHDNLTQTFQRLEEKLQTLLETVIPHRCIPIGLEKSGPTMFQAKLPDSTLMEGSEFYLAVAADVPEDRLVKEFPAKAKISSLDRVHQLVMMAVSGLPLRHVPNPPPEIPVTPGRTYFRLDRTGEHWEAIRSSHSFAFHVPPDFVGLKLELMAVKE